MSKVRKRGKGREEYVSDMNLSACAIMGQLSFHLSCRGDTDQKSLNLNLAFTPTCVSSQSCLILVLKMRWWRTVTKESKLDTEGERLRGWHWLKVRLYDLERK